MSDELQSDGAPEVTAETTENQELTGSALATDSEPEHEPKPEVDEAAKAKEATQKVINEKHFQAKQAERERDEARARLAEFEAKQREAEAAQAGEIPPIPDPYDDDFAAKLAARDEAIARKANFDANQRTWQEQQQLQRQELERQQALKNQQTIAEHRARAAALQISDIEISQAENVVLNYGLAPECLQEILRDQNSPVVIKHLAANPHEGVELASMSANPYQAAQYLATIKAKAEALKPRQSNTPQPSTDIKGAGVDVDLNKYPNSAGAKFS
jgi:hypothetical protein